MQLHFIPLDRLSVAKANMRYSRKPPEVADILPTVRARGVLQPLIVRPAARDESGATRYEILAGARRFHAASLVAEERRAAAIGEGDEAPDTDPDTGNALPCAVLEDGDTASAIEASLIENLARLPPHEVDQWTAFKRLTREGRTPQEIAVTFGLTDLAVRRVLALGSLLPRIRTLYRREDIDPASVRHLTLASAAQQKDWLALFDDPQAWCPTGHQLKSWLFGGQAIAVAHALFDVEHSACATIADLFGEERYFADSAAFWEAQNAALAALAERYRADGWSEVCLLPPETPFYSWDHAKASKTEGGRVYLAVRASGEVTRHEGYVTLKEARRIARDGACDDRPTAPSRPEMSSVTARYVDLHRHAAVRAALLERPDLALRLMVAHAIAGSPLWHVATEAQSCRNEAVAESVETCRAEARFDQRRRAALARLDLDCEEPTLTARHGCQRDCATLFTRLIALADHEVLDILAIAMGETLTAGGEEVAAAGLACSLDMRDWWQADEAFLATLRRRDQLLAILVEIAGRAVADAHGKDSLKTLRTLIGDHLEGRNGRSRCAPWTPRWMAFPARGYEDRARAQDAAPGPDAKPGSSEETDANDGPPWAGDDALSEAGSDDNVTLPDADPLAA